MATWQGFSDVELRRLKASERTGDRDHRVRRTHSGDARRPGDDHAQTGNRRPSQRDRQRAEQPRNPLDEEGEKKPGLNVTDVRPKSRDKDAQIVQTVLSSSVEQPDVLSRSQEVAPEAIDPHKEERISFECPASSLEDLQRRQREIEEENKRKKALLEKAVQERYLQSQAEVRKLHVVKEELDRLDFLVTRDVSVLRDKIEEANREYNMARRRFEVAEREYIESKMQLYRASEVKELLSEHLCAVIQHNEARKSTKLEELMSKLQMVESSGKEHGVGTRNRAQAELAAFLKTPTPGIDVWPSLTKCQTNTTSPATSATSTSASASGDGGTQPIPSAQSEEEEEEELSATKASRDTNGKEEISVLEPELAIAAADRQKQAGSAPGSSSDVLLESPRMD